MPTDISNDVVASAGGAELTALIDSKDRGASMAAMTSGVRTIISDLYAKGTIDAVFSLGGSGERPWPRRA
nr:Tm-1-like ATP-binding domain-containing protein [Flaviflexus ciconiae]